MANRASDTPGNKSAGSSAGREEHIPGNKYEEDLGAYLHFRIEERESPEHAFEKRVVPERIRHRRLWRRFHVQRKILVSKTASFFSDTRRMVVVWALLLGLVALSFLLEWDKQVIGGLVLVVGIVSSAFAWMGAAVLSGIAVVPFVGPALASILSSSVLWIINGLGYFVSVIAIRAGHGKTVLNYRLLVIVFLTGMVVGYVVARMLD